MAYPTGEKSNLKMVQKPEKEMVYCCPFSSCIFWDNNRERMISHLCKKHLKESLELLVDKCYIIAINKNSIWRKK